MRRTYSNHAVKDIKKIDSRTKQRIKKGIEKLPDGDVKKMVGYENLYRLRVGDWRIIFSYAERDVILIEEIGLRGDIY